jgi:PAS domain S-box-containing protein
MGKIARHRPAQPAVRRREAEGSERRALARHVEAFNRYASDILLVLDPEGRIVEANDRALESYGYARDQLVGMEFRDLRDPSAAPGLADAEVLFRSAGVEGMAFEALHRRKDGTIFPAEVSGRLVVIEGRHYYQGIVRDVTERKRAEEATAYQAMLLANMNEAVMGLDEKFLLRAWNRAAERIYGWKAEEVIGRPILRVLQTQYHRGYDSAMLARLQEDGRIRLEMRQVRKDGTPLDVEGVSVALRDAEGRITGYVAVNRDVTDRRRAEEALRRSEERLKLAVEATNDGLWDWNVPGDELYLSPRWYEMLGYGPEEIVGNAAVRRLVHPDDRPLLARRFRAHARGEAAAYEAQHRVLAKSGEWRWVHNRGKIVERGPSGKPVRVIGTYTDITDQKKMQAQLLQSDRMASMGTLAAGVAHEINNPLAYVVANLGYVIEELTDAGVVAAGPGASPCEEPARTLSGELLSETLRAMVEAREGAERVRAIVRDLKTFSRAEERGRGSADVRRVLESAINLARNEIRHRARMVTEFGEVPWVDASEHRLGQVFLNLLINAAQAIPEGRAQENEVRAVTRTDALGRAVVEIRDTGCGIAPGDLGRIFEPFYTTKPVGVGTGLGLSICHGIVTGLGGDVEVESEPGKGSVFRVILPAAPGQRSDAPAQTQASRPERGRILVVDDEPLVGKAVQRVLASQHEVVSESSARSALARLERGESFDLVLCDLMMPQMTGMELHAAVSAIAPEMAERFVFLTGGAFTPAAREFLDRSALRWVEKPFEPADLRDLVGKELRARRAREPGAGPDPEFH